MPCIWVNKLIGDLHTRFLEQGSNKVILAFSPPFSIVSSKEALENVNLWRTTLRSSERSNPNRRVHKRLRIPTKPSPSLLQLNSCVTFLQNHCQPANMGASGCIMRVEGGGRGVGELFLPSPGCSRASQLILHIWLLMQIIPQQIKSIPGSNLFHQSQA